MKGISMKQILVYLLAALLFSGCVASTPTKTQSELENLSFMDTSVFDQNLSESMSADTENINVAITGPVSINQIPKRLGKWLSMVVDKQGRVNVEPKTNTKVLGAVLGLLPTAYSFLKEEWSYGSVVNYNATIFYEPETGLIKKVVFTKRRDAQDFATD
ncbi:MAG: hypothetical protein DRR08_13195 [Candidatus Parabeggiatoa sp. nov. 2]|nr:MAG: hypothetical protein B6247_05895 [Beggiatoa sp. 4572_84]RKZ59737.1 MAG: hypothetical protein DRR08_13195 [Gammaproteobacteria bacterium]